MAASGHFVRSSRKQQEGGKAGSERLGFARFAPRSPPASNLLLASRGNIFGFGPPKTKMRSRLPCRPSRLPVLSEGLRHELSARRQPEALVHRGLRTPRKLLQAICGWAAIRCVESLAAARIAEASLAAFGPDVRSRKQGGGKIGRGRANSWQLALGSFAVVACRWRLPGRERRRAPGGASGDEVATANC